MSGEFQAHPPRSNPAVTPQPSRPATPQLVLCPHCRYHDGWKSGRLLGTSENTKVFCHPGFATLAPGWRCLMDSASPLGAPRRLNPSQKNLAAQIAPHSNPK